MLDKAIEHGKEHRKPYYRAGKHDKTCRPNGGCPYCYSNRMHKHKRHEPIMEADDADV
jgi:sulfatase maturation enzyme AslB (radical SAM superfamily)